MKPTDKNWINNKPAIFKSKDEEIEWLKYRIEELEELLGTAGEQVSDFRAMLGCTPMESGLLGLLMRRESITKPDAVAALYAEKPDVDLPDQKIIDVFVCKLRKKLGPRGIEVGTIWGRGYFISGENKTKLRLLVDDWRASKGYPVNGTPEKSTAASSHDARSVGGVERRAMAD